CVHASRQQLGAVASGGLDGIPRDPQRLALSHAIDRTRFAVRGDWLFSLSPARVNVFSRPALWLAPVFPPCARLSPVQAVAARYPEDGIPGMRLEGQAHFGEPVKAMLGFGFEEHRQSVAAILASRENFVSIQIHCC